MKTSVLNVSNTSVAARVAGEDLACGDFVTAISEIVEYPSFFWGANAIGLSVDEPVRVRGLPDDAGVPHQIIGVCLPFVYAKSCVGEVIVMDVRTQQLARLEQSCARAVWKDMKSSHKKRNA